MTQPLVLVFFAALMKLCGGSDSRDPGEPGFVARITCRWLERVRARDAWQPELAAAERMPVLHSRCG